MLALPNQLFDFALMLGVCFAFQIVPTDKMSVAICVNCRQTVDIVDNFPCFKDLCIKNQTEQPDLRVTECAKKRIPRKPKPSEQLPRGISVDDLQQQNTSESQNTSDSPTNVSSLQRTCKKISPYNTY